MKKLFVLATLLTLAGVAPGQMQVTGYLTSEMEPVEMDSVFLLYGSSQVWFPTPNWTANPGETTSFSFPDFPGWPAIIKYSGSVAGMPVFDSLYRPVADSWYPFLPPHEQVKIKFHGEGSGIEEPAVVFATPLLLNNLLSDPKVEVLNPAGIRVRSLPLAPGIYFYRARGTQNEVRRFVVIK